MKRKWFLSLLLLVIAITALGIISASALGGYTLDWWTADGGGGASTGGSYSLDGTIGQPDAGGTSSGGTYSLAGGFWGGAAAGYDLFLPIILR